MKKIAFAFLLVALTATAAPKPWLGMALKIRNDSSGGKFLYVAQAPQDAPAYQGGVREGDLITTIDGKAIRFRDDADLVEFSSGLKPGKVLKVRVIRAGKRHDLRVRVGTLPAEFEALYEESVRRARESRRTP